jgi:hypothetical protein
MTDQELIERLHKIACHMAANRIEELVRENRELTLQLLATSGQAADALDKLTKAEKNRDGYLAERNKFQLYLQRTHADLELEVAAVDALTAKLAKAVEALRKIEADCDADYQPSHGAIKYAIRAVLAELEGGSEPDQKQSL